MVEQTEFSLQQHWPCSAFTVAKAHPRLGFGHRIEMEAQPAVVGLVFD